MSELNAQGWHDSSLGWAFEEQAPETVALYCFEPTGAGPNRGRFYVLSEAEAAGDHWRPCPSPVTAYVYPPDSLHGNRPVFRYGGDPDYYYSNNSRAPQSAAYPAPPGEPASQEAFTVWDS